MSWKFTRNVLLKALGLFLVLNVIMGLFQPVGGLNNISVYNLFVPGRVRFPFGEDPSTSYNLTIGSLEAMFASHEINKPKRENEYRVVVVGDSSVWGTLLRPEQTLAGTLNAYSLSTRDGRRVTFYNLGYPTLSLWKDVLIISKAIECDPDLIIWVMTLESFPGVNPQDSPLLSVNQEELDGLMGLDRNDHPIKLTFQFSETVIGARRELADWLRLQLYGFMWAATGIDQTYPDSYESAQRDLEDDLTLNGMEPAEMASILEINPIAAGMELAGDTPLLIVNEPILISRGENSNIRYNFYYPRWAYDGYREWMGRTAQEMGWDYLDAWDLVDEQNFTNSAIHLDPVGETRLAQAILEHLKTSTSEVFR